MKHTSPIFAYYDLENPTTLDPTFGSWVPKVPVNLGTNANGAPSLAHPGSRPVYSREHPYEAQMGKTYAGILVYGLMTLFPLHSCHLY